ncbi:Surfeit locus protein 2, putative isoform 3 [Hibiscus syriacus]|uniref:Surfeit locus protein 2, putative isoform 3 n=1 Tax=Hibiscus syriacus TaxID=106335 RepID=A0A6A2YNJ6_HIBSY|nr:surfeit locus protein 2-like isoform X2 [Hibiscus syriacus]KAE8680893.1 Surfeit locus protein 2, putative isoform 3 [Hibiscus syriacus]
MGEATEEKKGCVGGSKEGANLLGGPTFSELPNGRLKCVETGHEMVVKDKDSYAQSKRCRLGLIDFALSHSKPPLNMFKQDPLSRSKLICKLTGHTVNKSEEHIWKHINGKRFLNKLEQKEMETVLTDETMAEEGEKKPKKEKKKQKKKKEKVVEEIISEVRDSVENESDSEEHEFWIPPVGDRWDFDDGGDRWGSGSEPDESDDEDEAEDVAKESGKESKELSTRAKRMSIDIGPSSFASRKKKSRKNTS